VSFAPERFHVVHTAPVWMSMHERVLVYGVTVGLQPERILEIGTFQGGSTLIMCAALDDLDRGRIVCVDPDPRVKPEDWEAVAHRATMVPEPSPEALGKAAEIAGGGFDFALIDGDHTYDGVIRDIEATIPTLADDAHLLFHDAHYFQVRDAIDHELRVHDGAFEDGGMLSVDFSPDVPDADGNEVRWGGLRMLRFRRNGA